MVRQGYQGSVRARYDFCWKTIQAPQPECHNYGRVSLYRHAMMTPASLPSYPATLLPHAMSQFRPSHMWASFEARREPPGFDFARHSGHPNLVLECRFPPSPLFGSRR